MAEAIKKYGANRLAIAPVNDGPVVSGTMIAVDLRPDEKFSGYGVTTRSAAATLAVTRSFR